MDPIDRRARTVRRLAWACAALVLAITTASAFLRLSASASPALAASFVGAVRIAHRVAASATLVLVIALLMKTLAQQPARWREGRLVLALLALSLFLAVLGRMAGASRAPAVVLGNLLAGFALLALAVRLALADRAAPGPLAPLRAWTWTALALLVLQLAWGGAVSASASGRLCVQDALCEAHAGAGVVLLAVLLPLVFAAWRRGAGGRALLPGGLVLAQAALGVLLATSPGGSLPLALAHNVASALLLAALVALLP